MLLKLLEKGDYMRNKVLGLLLAGIIAVMNCTTIFTAFSDDIEDNAEDNPIIKTDTFTEPYKSRYGDIADMEKYYYMECNVDVYKDSKVVIKVKNVYSKEKVDMLNYNLGTITFPSTYFNPELDDTRTILKYKIGKHDISENNIKGYDFSYGYGTETDSLKRNGLLFTLTLIPTIYLKEETTINVFGHEINIPVSQPEYNPHNDLINRLDANNDGIIDGRDASMVLTIYALNSVGYDIKTMGDYYDIINNR